MLTQITNIRKILKSKLSEMLTIKKENSYGILVIDESTRDILSVLFKVSDFRLFGICGHYMVDSIIPNIPNVPVMYYISSFERILDKITSKDSKTLAISSSTQIKRCHLENYGTKLAELGIKSTEIPAVYDTFTNFIALQHDLFEFNLKDSYLINYEDEIISGLISFFATIEKNPVIIGEPVNVKDSSVLRIFNKLYDKIKRTKLIKQTLKRPLLIMVDRSMDLITPCLHVMGYLEMIDDLYGFHLNKIEANDFRSEIDADTDFFKSNRFTDFPEVVDLVEKEIIDYKKEKSLRTSNKSSDLTSLLEDAPEFQKRSDIANSHLDFCSHAVSVIKERRLDDFYSIEKAFNKDELSEVTDYGTDQDIIRLCVSLINTKNEDLIKPILEKRKINTQVIQFIKELQTEDNHSLIQQGLKFLFSKQIPAVNYVEDIISKLKNNTIEKFYSVGNLNSSFYWSEVSEVVVFFTGGVSFYEFKKIKELENKHNIQFIVGSSEIINAESLLHQIERYTR